MIFDGNGNHTTYSAVETSIICKVLPLQVMQGEHFIIIDPPFIVYS